MSIVTLSNGKPLDDRAAVFVIAEASGNHGRNYAMAEALVRAAAAAGADAVKFQTFEPDEIAADIPFPYGRDAETDAWARRLGVVRFPDLFRHGGLPRAWHASLRALAEELGLAFLSTPFSVTAARFLVEDIGVPALKIASGDLTYTPLLEYANASGLPVILSTGGATLDEIDTALIGPLQEAWVDDRLVLLHCRSIYPCPLDALNLRCVATLRERYDLPVGFSDHTISDGWVANVAQHLGMTVYEKHVRLDGETATIDAAHSLDARGLARCVTAIRRFRGWDTAVEEPCLGDGVKAPHALERHDRLWARRSEKDWLRPTEAARQGAWE